MCALALRLPSVFTMEAEQHIIDWSALPSAVLQSIAALCESVAFVGNIRLVCSSWKAGCGAWEGLTLACLVQSQRVDPHWLAAALQAFPCCPRWRLSLRRLPTSALAEAVRQLLLAGAKLKELQLHDVPRSFLAVTSLLMALMELDSSGHLTFTLALHMQPAMLRSARTHYPHALTHTDAHMTFFDWREGHRVGPGPEAGSGGGDTATCIRALALWPACLQRLRVRVWCDEELEAVSGVASLTHLEVVLGGEGSCLHDEGGGGGEAAGCVSYESVQQLQHLHCLTLLSLQHQLDPVTGAGFPHHHFSAGWLGPLAQLPHLTHLTWDMKAPRSSDDLSFMAGFGQLTHLSLRTSLPNGSCLLSLSCLLRGCALLPALYHLHLHLLGGEAPLTTSTMEDWQLLSSSLRRPSARLALTLTPLTGPHGVMRGLDLDPLLGAAPCLRRLEVRGALFSDSLLQCSLPALTRLTHLTLKGGFKKVRGLPVPLSSILCGLTRVEEVDLCMDLDAPLPSRLLLDDESAALTSSSLQSCRLLRLQHVMTNGLSEKGARALAGAGCLVQLNGRQRWVGQWKEGR